MHLRKALARKELSLYFSAYNHHSTPSNPNDVFVSQCDRHYHENLVSLFSAIGFLPVVYVVNLKQTPCFNSKNSALALSFAQFKKIQNFKIDKIKQ